MRYSYSRNQADNIGASDFSLPERAFNRANTTQTFQLTETAIISPAMMNETRFQYIRNRSQQDGNNIIPTIVVQEAFISGGSQIGLAHNDEDRWELQNYSTWTKGRHILRFGVRVARCATSPTSRRRTSAARSLSPAATRRSSMRTIRSCSTRTAIRCSFRSRVSNAIVARCFFRAIRTCASLAAA